MCGVHRHLPIYYMYHIIGVLLTIVWLMRAIDPLKYEQQTLDYLGKLQAVDSMRTNYYNDLSKYIQFVFLQDFINC